MFVDFCFLSGFSEYDDCCVILFSWRAQLMCSQGFTASVGGWDTGEGWGREVRRGRSVGPTEI